MQHGYHNRLGTVSARPATLYHRRSDPGSGSQPIRPDAR
jgi:hypothetical protein